MVWGVLPGRPGVSWLGHLFGVAGGVLAAYLLADRV
jgi:membrane associated rhomboid family serine protease